MIEQECPSEDCLLCNGEACNLCGAGCWNNSAKNCTHDVMERHEEADYNAAFGPQCQGSENYVFGDTGYFRCPFCEWCRIAPECVSPVFLIPIHDPVV